MRAFGDDDDAEARAQLVAVADALRDLLQVVGDLGNQDDVGATGDAAVQGDPAGVAAHDFDDHDAAMRFGRRVQPIDRVGREADGGVEAETARRADDVVVDGLRHADERNAFLVELVRDGQRAVAADAHERVELHLAEHLDHAIGVVEGALRRDDRREKRVAGVHGAEHRAAETQDAGHVARAEDARLLRIDQPVEAVLETDDLNAGVARRLDDGADDGVQTWSVTTAGEHSDFLHSGHQCGTWMRGSGRANRV